MAPTLSYTLWFTQRVGSVLLGKALESTQVAGVPNELLNVEHRDQLFERYHVTTPADFQQTLWRLGSTPNGVFALKFSFYEPFMTQIIDLLCQFPDAPRDPKSRVEVWENAFPNHKHLFLTRRNKIRLAVSWWKAIQSNDWHRPVGQPPIQADLSDKYNFDAINHLHLEASMREAGIADFFAEAGIVPLTIVYEDLVQEYEPTVRRILDYLGIKDTPAPIAPPAVEQTADAINEEWVQRFREERQKGWINRGW